MILVTFVRYVKGTGTTCSPDCFKLENSTREPDLYPDHHEHATTGHCARMMHPVLSHAELPWVFFQAPPPHMQKEERCGLRFRC